MQYQILDTRLEKANSSIMQTAKESPNKTLSSCQKDIIEMLMSEQERINSLRRIGAVAFLSIAFSLIVIIMLGVYLSNREINRQLEIVRLKNNFISTLSHELKTPIASMRLLAERLLNIDSTQTQKQREYYNLILTQSYHLSHLIGNFLDFTRIEEGKERYNFEKANLSEVLNKTLENYPLKLVRPDVKIEPRIDTSTESYLDKEAISRAFVNLLDNALKFSPPEATVNISMRRDGGQVIIEVKDQGPGIEDSEKNKIFDRFYDKAKGTGLGLALVRQIVLDHGGRIELDSAAGKGSTFRIMLPIKESL